MPVRFQVDGDFYDHPKSIGLTDAAVALWTRAGSYSAAKRTKGFIPAHVLTILTQTPEAARELVSAGLWKRVKGGYRFGPLTQLAGRPWIPTWLRAAVYERDGYRCIECGAAERLSLDHIRPWSRGGLDTYENLRTLCLPCNWSRGVGA